VSIEKFANEGRGGNEMLLVATQIVKMDFGFGPKRGLSLTGLV
jgi:hypothetical protein